MCRYFRVILSLSGVQFHSSSICCWDVVRLVVGQRMDGGKEIKGRMRGGQKDDEAAAMVNLRVENAVHSDSSNF